MGFIAIEPLLAKDLELLITQDRPLKVESDEPYDYVSGTKIEVWSRNVEITDFESLVIEGNVQEDLLERALVCTFVFERFHLSDYWDHEERNGTDLPVDVIFDNHDQTACDIYKRLIEPFQKNRVKYEFSERYKLDGCFNLCDIVLVSGHGFIEQNDAFLFLFMEGFQAALGLVETTVVIPKTDETKGQNWENIGFKYHKRSDSWVCDSRNMRTNEVVQEAFYEFWGAKDDESEERE